MNFTSIKEAINSLAQSLQISMIFPATLLILTNIYIIIPLCITFDSTSATVTTFALSLSIVAGYVFYAFNFPAIRFLEGYKFRRIFGFNLIFDFLVEQQRSEFKLITARLDDIDFEINELNYMRDMEGDFEPSASDNSIIQRIQSLENERISLLSDLDLRFPGSEATVLPTPLGNSIKAAEDYPRLRYGMDAVALWPRLVPLLRKTDFLPFVTQEKSVFDFLLNMIIVSTILGIEFFYTSMYLGHWVLGLAAAGASIFILVFLYQGLIIAARQWGTAIRVAFDLHRHLLHRHLGLAPQTSFDGEVSMWQSVSRFYAYRNQSGAKDHFIRLSEQEDVGSYKPAGDSGKK